MTTDANAPQAAAATTAEAAMAAEATAAAMAAAAAAAEPAAPPANDFTIPGHNGEPVPVRTLLRDGNSDRDIHIVVTPDNMRAYIRVAPGPNFSGMSGALVRQAAEAAGLTRGLIEPGLDLFAHFLNTPGSFSGFFEIAAGVPMRKGEDGSIEFHVQPTSMEPRYDESDNGKIDFKQLNLIENCFSGQRVASVLPPGPGREGTDLFGTVIPPQPGAPAKARPGEGVTLSSNGREFTSQIEGRLVYEDDVLSISPLLTISRDIDYSVGNVDFVGTVAVRGNLLDGFSINGKRGVEITGDVGAARITSGGDVKITGGVKGKNAAIIACRNLTAHYLDDAVVEATGDVVATKEIVNSSVKALGRVSVTTGTIIGGDVIGYRGVEADAVGSDMGVPTRVAAGLNWTEENTKEEIRAKLAELMERAHSAKALLAPLFADKELTSRLSAEQKALLADIISELREVRQSIADALEEKAQVLNHCLVGMVNQINVRKSLRQGVFVRFSAISAKVQDDVKGPLSLTQDTGRGVMVTGAFTKLPELAQAAGEGAAPNG